VAASASSACSSRREDAVYDSTPPCAEHLQPPLS
jgi:hypothetical protein